MNPLFTASNSYASNSERLNHGHITMLKDKEQVDEWSTFTECGWFCIVGYKNKRRVLYAHCDKMEDFERMMYPERFVRDYGDFDDFYEFNIITRGR